VSFAGIERLRIGAIAGTYQREGSPPVPLGIHALDGRLPQNGPPSASGKVRIAGHEIGFELRSAPLDELGASKNLPIQGTLNWSGVQATVDGVLRQATLEGKFEASAADAAAALASVGIVARDAGPLALRGRFTITAGQASARDLVLTLGNSDAVGSAAVDWAGPVPSIAIDLRSEHFDAKPFLGGTPRAGEAATAEAWIAGLDLLATASQGSLQLAAEDIAGLPVAATKLSVELRSKERKLAANATGIVAGTPVEVSLDYDARKPQRTLAASIDGGAARGADLPGGALVRDLNAGFRAVRGRMSGQGVTPDEIIGSLRADVDAHGLDWSLARPPRAPLSGRLDLLRISVQGAQASSMQLAGRIDGAACTLKLTGGALALLLADDAWPIQLAGTCPGERIAARGRIAIGEPHVTADLAFDLHADRRGPVAGKLGLPHPLSARGAVTIDEKHARVRFDAMRAGRSTGSGEIAYPFRADEAPRVKVALATLSLDEFGTVKERASGAGDPLGSILLPADLHLPDVDLDIAAERIELRGANLRRFRFAGSLRSRRMQAAPFRIEWDKASASGQLWLDFTGARPRLQIDGTAENADLHPLLAGLGAEDVRIRVGRLALTAKAQGARLRELLVSATVNATAEAARVELRQPLLPGSSGRGMLSATVKAAPGTPSTLRARGEFDSRPVDLAVDGPAVDAFTRDGAAAALTVRATLGDVRLQAEGTMAGDGRGEGRMRVAGDRLDRLGGLLGVALPEVQPYSASADVSVSPTFVGFDDLNATFGKSRIAGRLRIDRRESRRPMLAAALRAPVLHLEDIGASEWTNHRDAADTRSPAGRPAQRAQAAIERLLDVLRIADVDASIGIDALYGGGQPFASARLQASVEAGRLRLALRDMRTQDGSASADLQVDAAASPPRFAISANARGIEYGALLRAMNPASTLDGRADFVLDLSTRGKPGHLLPALRGAVDLAAYPRGMTSDALGIWGSGLLMGILRAVDPDSKANVECSVAGFEVANGAARSDGFFVETTQVRIIGDLELRLDSGEITGRIDSQSSKPELFAIAPTMLVRGTFDEPKVSVAPASLVLAPLRFASPMSLFARDWLGRRDGRADPAAGCRDAFERVLQARLDAAGER